MDTDMNMPPHRKMVKARAKLVQHDPFFGAIALRLRVRGLTPQQVAQSRVNRMGTDSVFLVYNPVWVAQATIRELIGANAHEACHVALKHSLRRGDRDFKLWNIACDYAINSILISAGYELPDDIRHDEQYDGLAAEKIYKELKQEADEKKQEQKELEAFIATTDDDGDETDDNGDETDDGGDENSDQTYELPDFDDDEYDPDDENFGMPELPEDMDDFTGGVVLDAPEDAKDQEAKLDLEVQTAAIAAKMAGKLPGDMERVIQSQHVHKIDYKDLLRDWMERNIFPGNYTWKKPNRRYSGAELNLPSMDSEYDLPNIGVAIDASGSVTDHELEVYTGEISGVLSEFQCSFTALYFDEYVRNKAEFSVEDLPIELKVTAGGGTRFRCVFEYIVKHSIEMQALLFFTDMGAWDWDTLHEVEPSFPVLWMNTNRYSDDRKVPFGFTIPLEVDDDY